MSDQHSNDLRSLDIFEEVQNAYACEGHALSFLYTMATQPDASRLDVLAAMAGAAEHLYICRQVIDKALDDLGRVASYIPERHVCEEPLLFAQEQDDRIMTEEDLMCREDDLSAELDATALDRPFPQTADCERDDITQPASGVVVLAPLETRRHSPDIDRVKRWFKDRAETVAR